MKKETKILVIILVVALIVRLFFLNFLPIKDTATSPIFISDLLGISIRSGWLINLLFGLGNIVLLWFITKRILSWRVAALSSLIYAISPWTSYIEMSGSTYIPLLFFSLITFFGVLLTNEKNKWGNTFIISGSVILLLSSFFYWLILPIFYIYAYKSNFLKLQRIYFIGLIFILIFMSIIFTHNLAFRNHLNNQVTIFSDIGIINSVNTFQGEITKSNFKIGRAHV